MYTFANPSMLPELKELWMECFGDEIEYVEFFFQHVLHKTSFYNNLLVALEGKKPVSMLTMIPATILLNGSIKKIYYIYAVATKTTHRSHGYARGLLDFAAQIARREEAGLMLVPASESLFHYYESLGFVTKFFVKRDIFDCQKEVLLSAEQRKKELQRNIEYQIREIDTETYYTLREKQRKEEGDVRWNRKEIQYALLENTFIGGKSYEVRVNGCAYLLLGCPQNTCYYVREHTLPKELLREISMRLAKEHHCVKVVSKSKVTKEELLHYKEENKEETSSIYPYGMVYPAEFGEDSDFGYLGLALD